MAHANSHQNKDNQRSPVVVTASVSQFFFSGFFFSSAKCCRPWTKV